MSVVTYLTTDELSARIKYDSRTIRDRLVGARPIFLRRARRANTQGMQPVLND